jgi:uncharacterized protein (DUF58 family)
LKQVSLFKKYLDPAVLSNINNLELRARLVVEGFITGLHKSPFHGFSVEFSQHRPYNYGDNLKYIDWKVFGRTDRFFIKQFEEETNLKAYILLDVSNSMTFSTTSVSKLDYGKNLAAAMSYLMLLQHDAVGLSLFDSQIQKILPPRSVSSYLQPILTELDTIQAGKDTDIGPILHTMSERLKRRGLIILISDLYDNPENVLSGLRHFRYNQHEVLVFHLLDPAELSFDFEGDIEFEDLESGEKIRTYPWYIRQEYIEAVNKFEQSYRRQCREYLIDYHLLTTDQTLDLALMEYMIKRKKLG